MPKQKYTVCYSDPAFPCIMETDDDDGVSFSEAKRQLISSLKGSRDHWSERLREARKLRKPGGGDPYA